MNGISHQRVNALVGGRMPGGIFLADGRLDSSMTGMGKMVFVVAIVILVGLGFWHGTGGLVWRAGDVGSMYGGKNRELGLEEGAGELRGFRTKAAHREYDGSSATHRPERLKDFMLPEVVIDGLELDAALEKVMEAYRDACERSGETALAVRFVVPPGTDRKLHLRLVSKSFKASVQLLATLAGMKVSRDGLVYRFARMEDERRMTKQTLNVSPDLQAMLKEMVGHQDASAPVRDLVERMGLDLDASTRLTLGEGGRLVVETVSTADAAAVSALARLLEQDRPFQQKYSTKVIQMPADVEWTPPDLAAMDAGEMQIFVRDMAQREGVDLMTFPTVTARAGQSTTIEMINEMIVPTDESATAFETHELGHVMRLQGSALGFGHDVAIQYTHTTGDLDSGAAVLVVKKPTEVEASGFSPNSGARFVVQTRPDGSRAIVLVTAVFIDATGKPRE